MMKIVPRETYTPFYMKQAAKQGKRNQTGAYGEQIAATYVQNQGFVVLDTNYLKKWGEIDIVARETVGQRSIVHFIEVKTVSYETKTKLQEAVSHGTWRPEEQVTAFKLKKLHRVIESWLLEHNRDTDWQIDVAAVRIVPKEKYATIQLIPNVIG